MLSGRDGLRSTATPAKNEQLLSETDDADKCRRIDKEQYGCVRLWWCFLATDTEQQEKKQENTMGASYAAKPFVSKPQAR